MYKRLLVLSLVLVMALSAFAVNLKDAQALIQQQPVLDQAAESYNVPVARTRDNVGEYVDHSKNGFGWLGEETEHITYDPTNNRVLMAYRGWDATATGYVFMAGKDLDETADWSDYSVRVNTGEGYGAGRYPGAAINADGMPIVAWTEYTGSWGGGTYGGVSAFSYDEFGWGFGSFTSPTDNYVDDFGIVSADTDTNKPIDLWKAIPFLNASGELVIANYSWSDAGVWSMLATLDGGYQQNYCHQLFTLADFPADPEDASSQFGPAHTMFVMKDDLGYVFTQGTVGGEDQHPYVWYRKTTDGGHTWGPKVKIDNIPGTPIGSTTEYTNEFNGEMVTVTWDQSVYTINGGVTLDNDGNLHMVASMDGWFVADLMDPQLDQWVDNVYDIIIAPDGSITANHMRPWGYHSDRYYNTFEQFASIACDDAGNLIHTWMDAPDTLLYYYAGTPGNGGSDPDFLVCDIFAMASSDGGVNWTPYDSKMNITNTHTGPTVADAEKYPCLAQQLNSVEKTGYLAYEYKAEEMTSDDPDDGEHYLHFMAFDYSPLVPAENAVVPTVQTRFALAQNSPNPFNPETKIAFNMDQAAHVELAIYNVKGQKVKTLINEEMQAGNHAKMWNGTNENNESVSSGVYFYSLKMNDRIETKKMVLMK